MKRELAKYARARVKNPIARAVALEVIETASDLVRRNRETKCQHEGAVVILRRDDRIVLACAWCMRFVVYTR